MSTNTPSAPAPSTPASSQPAAAPSVGTTATQDAQTNASPTEEVQQEKSIDSAVEQAAEGQNLTKEEKQELKKWMLKSNGKTREVTDEKELLRLAQLGLGAHEKFEQAAQTRKKAESVLELLQKDPAKALQSLGYDVRKMAEEYLVQEANKQMMSPEERQKSEITAEIERLKAEKDQMVREKREHQIAQLQTKYEADIQDQILKAIDQYKLPKNPKTVARIAEYMSSALENGYEASALDVAPRIRTDLEEEHRSLFGHYDVEDLVKILGDEQLKKIRQYEVQKVKAKAPPAPVKTEPVITKKTDEVEKPKKSMTMDDFQAELNKYLK